LLKKEKKEKEKKEGFVETATFALRDNCEIKM
jgi:hypothetical protein